jgi:PiT family inorganic phosphate transporter
VTAVTVAMLFASMLMGWGIGANDAANAMGTAVGAGARSVKTAVWLVAGFGLLGALLLGGRVTMTIGKGIIPIEQLSPWIRSVFALGIALGAGLTVAVSTRLKLPTSTAHAIIGAVLGCAVAWGKTTLVVWTEIWRVVAGFLLTPITALVISYILFTAGNWVYHQFYSRRLGRSFWVWVLTVSGCLMAFAWGTNDVANIAGPLVGSGILSPSLAILFSGVAMSIGVITGGARVMETIGHGITKLSPEMALAAELAAATNIILYTWLSLPASSSHTIVGTILGVGFACRRRMSYKTVGEILIAWGTTPLSGFALGFLFLKLFQLVAQMVGILV